jgi:hypothetical protein
MGKKGQEKYILHKASGYGRLLVVVRVLGLQFLVHFMTNVFGIYQYSSIYLVESMIGASSSP